MLFGQAKHVAGLPVARARARTGLRDTMNQIKGALRDSSSPPLEILLLQSGIISDIHELLKDAVVFL